MAKNKYWRNLNLAVGNRAYRIQIFIMSLCFVERKSARGSAEVRRPKSKSWKSFNYRVVFKAITYTKSTWTPLLGEVLSAA